MGLGSAMDSLSDTQQDPPHHWASEQQGVAQFPNAGHLGATTMIFALYPYTTELVNLLNTFFQLHQLFNKFISRGNFILLTWLGNEHLLL